MSESTADALSRLAAELRGLPEDLPVITLLAALSVPLPTLKYDLAENAPDWVARKLDGCDGRRCMEHVAPTLWSIDGDTLVAGYLCGRCRSAWWTSWHIEPEEVAA